jgi:hypothetical protein
MMEGPDADSEEKHEPVSDIDIAVVDSLKALDPKRPIGEADIQCFSRQVGFGPKPHMASTRLHLQNGQLQTREGTFSEGLGRHGARPAPS